MAYTYINSIDDLDPNRIPITDLKKKYIDKEGNRYAARFNPASMRVEIVYLVSSKEEALRLRQDIRRKRKEYEDDGEGDYSGLTEQGMSESTESYQSADPSSRFPATTPVFIPDEGNISPDGEDSYNQIPKPYQASSSQNNMLDLSNDHFDPYNDDEHFSITESEEQTPVFGKEADEKYRPFYESRFLEETNKLLDKTNDRLFAIVNSTKKARIFEFYKATEYFDLTRQIDGEARQSLEKTMNLYKEIALYPRPLNYYLARISDEKKVALDLIDDEEKKFEKVKRWELQAAFRETFKLVLHYSELFHSLLNGIPEEKMAVLPRDQQNLIKNSLTSAELVIFHCKETLGQVTYWEKTHV
jgi:hypothetical protein